MAIHARPGLPFIWAGLYFRLLTFSRATWLSPEFGEAPRISRDSATLPCSSISAETTTEPVILWARAMGGYSILGCEISEGGVTLGSEISRRTEAAEAGAAGDEVAGAAAGIPGAPGAGRGAEG